MMMTKLMRQIPWSKVMVLLLLVWLLFLLIALGGMKYEPDQLINERVTQALKDLQTLHSQREEISKLIAEYSSAASMKQEEKDALIRSIQEKINQPTILGGAGTEVANKGEPPLEYEKIRRKIRAGVQEMWYFLESELQSTMKFSEVLSPRIASRISKILEESSEHKRSILKDVGSMMDADGYAAWRLKEAVELSDLVQRRIKYLQNPPSCSEAKKLVCSLSKGCGFGCQLHHVVYCLLVAYGTERTLIMESKGWRYNKAGWEAVFLPVSSTCTTTDALPIARWPNHAAQVITLGVIDSISPRPAYIPLSVPKDLADRISRLHENPSVWWIGQFVKYLFRFQPQTTDMIKEAALKYKFQHPIVGVHIRRTDKVGTEAAFHPVEEYMKHVEAYFKQLEMQQPVSKRRIYLATDDPKVFVEMKYKYPDYEILGDPLISKTAAVATRYTDSSLNGIIMDIYFLSQSDFMVCTFSSQVSRLAYELMQSLHPDSASKFASLDDIYYYGGQSPHKMVAVLPHKATSAEQIDLEVGDIVVVAGNHWNGYSKGRNLRTSKLGLYPSFKVDDLVDKVDFPPYKEVPLHSRSGT